MAMKGIWAAVLVTALTIGQQDAIAYSVSGRTIYNDSGAVVQLKGVNWFGFDTSDHTVHGLWARNWKQMIQQMKDQGFNAVRLPFCPTTLRGVATSSIDYSLNPDLSGKNSLAVLDAVITELNRQGPDTGPSYRSAIFAQNPEQRQVAAAYIAQLGKTNAFGKPIVTRIETGKFFAAESYHQDFFRQNPYHPYIVRFDKPKVAAFKAAFAPIAR